MTDTLERRTERDYDLERVRSAARVLYDRIELWDDFMEALKQYDNKGGWWNGNGVEWVAIKGREGEHLYMNMWASQRRLHPDFLETLSNAIVHHHNWAHEKLPQPEKIQELQESRFQA